MTVQKENCGHEDSFSSALLDGIISEGARDFFKSAPDDCIALLLTGSVAREEGSFLLNSNGCISNMGDVEFLLVSEAGARGNAVAKEFEIRLKDLLADSGIESDVDVGYVRPDYFGRLKPHIFGVELKAHAKVLAGDESIVEMIPELSAKDIPRWDGINLLFNRMVEQIMRLDGLINGGAEDIRRAHYHNIKLTLDIAGSLLVFQGSYRTTYLERTRVIGQAVAGIDHALTRETLSGLAVKLKEWTSIKLNPSSDEILSWNGEAAKTEEYRERTLKRWLELVRMVKSLWTWEMNNYLGGSWSDDTETLLKRYQKREGLTSRARGWAKWVSRLRKNGAVPYASLLKLFPIGSPRALIYASAALLYFSLPSLLEESALEKNEDSIWKENAKRAGELLPGFSEAIAADWTSLCANVTGSWEEHVKNG
ncbi:MAG: hypothetical protein V3V95_03780 [Thermodesulfobacteriota bacterium]